MHKYHIIDFAYVNRRGNFFREYILSPNLQAFGMWAEGLLLKGKDEVNKNVYR